MKIKIRDALIIINTLLIVITAVVIMSLYSAGIKYSVYSISNSLMKEIVNSVVNKTQLYLQPAEKANADIAFHYWNPDVSNFAANTELSLSYFKELLKANPEFVMVYFADDKGNLVMSRRMPDGTLTKRYITREIDGVRTVFAHENEAYNSLFSNTFESLEKGYDPRGRVWYRTALEKKSMHWTDVYIFATDKLPGFSCAMPIYGSDGSLIGVSCIDIGIRDLSLFLGKIEITENAKLFIMDSKNQIIAEPLKLEESVDKLFSVSVKDGKEVSELRKIENLDDIEITASHKEYLRQGDKSQPFSYKIDGKKYSAMYASLVSERGLNFKIGVVIPDTDIMGKVYESNLRILILSLFFVVCAILFSIYIANFISRPMKKLSLEMNNLRKFAINDEKDIKTIISELDGMIGSFEGMKKGLVNFKKYVPSEVVNRLIENDQDAKLGGEKKELTMFFSDIANFTNISEMISPENLVNQLCEYFSLMSHTILDKNGTLDKYIGDSIMAFWGAPNTLDNHAFLACQSALICKDLTFTLSHQWEREGKPTFHTRIGIHTAEVIVGNMGYEQRFNYTIIGDGVNLASRLEGINKFYSTEIMVSESTYLQVKDQFEFRMLDKIAVKGKSKPIVIYELLSVKEKLNENKRKIYSFYEKGLDYYFKGNWKKAVACMDQILQHMKDPPASIIKERSEAFIKHPPLKWDGVHVFTEK